MRARVLLMRRTEQTMYKLTSESQTDRQIQVDGLDERRTRTSLKDNRYGTTKIRRHLELVIIFSTSVFVTLFDFFTSGTVFSQKIPVDLPAHRNKEPFESCLPDGQTNRPTARRTHQFTDLRHYDKRKFNSTKKLKKDHPFFEFFIDRRSTLR